MTESPRRQCTKCPWKVSTDPNTIPDGYCPHRHAALTNTIAEPGNPNGSSLRIMACHESSVGEDQPCVGWLVHQLGVGNNIPLRLAVWCGQVDSDVVAVGRQHQTLEDTLPCP